MTGSTAQWTARPTSVSAEVTDSPRHRPVAHSDAIIALSAAAGLAVARYVAVRVPHI